MRPVDIGPHPDAPDHYVALGKPADWNDEDCSSLCIRRVGATGDMFYEPAARIVNNQLASGASVYPAYMSEWRPSAEELELLNKGEPIRMLVSGNVLPPVALWVRGQSEI